MEKASDLQSSRDSGFHNAVRTQFFDRLWTVFKKSTWYAWRLIANARTELFCGSAKVDKGHPPMAPMLAWVSPSKRIAGPPRLELPSGKRIFQLYRLSLECARAFPGALSLVLIRCVLGGQLCQLRTSPQNDCFGFHDKLREGLLRAATSMHVRRKKLKRQRVGALIPLLFGIGAGVCVGELLVMVPWSVVAVLCGPLAPE